VAEQREARHVPQQQLRGHRAGEGRGGEANQPSSTSSFSSSSCSWGCGSRSIEAVD
jgi:hypothetical protein